MAKVRYLLDESVPERLADVLVAQEPAMEVFLIGESPAPPKGTLDPEVLKYAESNRLTLLFMDKRVGSHLEMFFETGRKLWGVFFLRRGFPIQRYVDDLVLIWSTTEAEEWRDSIDWLPW